MVIPVRTSICNRVLWEEAKLFHVLLKRHKVDRNEVLSKSQSHQQLSGVVITELDLSRHSLWPWLVANVNTVLMGVATSCVFLHFM